MKSILMLVAAMALTLTLSACGTKYESWSWADNNCSGNSGIHDAAFCEDYVAGQ
jgi:hypothetical protein